MALGLGLAVLLILVLRASSSGSADIGVGNIDVYRPDIDPFNSHESSARAGARAT
jgi:hypothetical protein